MRSLVVVLFLTVASTVVLADDRRLSLEEIKRFAVSQNLSLKAAEAEIREAAAQTTQYRSNYYPRMAVVAGPEILQEDLTTSAEALTYLEAKWNLFRGSLDRVQIQVSEINEQILRSALKKAQFEVELEVEALFYRHLSTSEKIKAHDQSLQLNERHRQLLRRKQGSGLASQADVMEFELRDSYLKSAVSNLVQEREEARIGLVRLMGPSIQSRFEPVGSLPHVHLKRSLSAFLEQINSTSEAVQMASLRSASASIEARSARAMWFPQIDLEARYGRLPVDVASSAPAFHGILALRWELFSGFETTSRIAELKARVERNESEFRQKILSTMTAAEVNYLKLKSLQEQVHVEEGNEERAQKYYSAVLDEYRRGLKNGADLKSAEATLLDARNRAIDFKFAFIDTKIKLERDIGLYVETDVHKEN